MLRLAVVLVILNSTSASAQFTSGESASTGAAGTLAPPEGGRGVRSSEKRSLQILLREGTYLGPLRGRFVVRGQRWSFLVDQQASGDDTDKSQLIDDGLAREVRTDQNTLLGQRRGESTTAEHALQSLTPSSTIASKPVFDSMIVVENLMLDRIARAIDDDPQDDYWTITARVTEFQDENRLMILTANRAPRTTP